MHSWALPFFFVFKPNKPLLFLLSLGNVSWCSYLRFWVLFTIHCSLARNSLVIWSNVTEDQFLNYVLASCLIFKKKKKEKKCLIVLCQMIATWCPNLLFPVVFLPFVNTGTSLSPSPQEHLWLLVQCPLPRCGPPPHPGPPSSSCFSELNWKSTTVSPLSLAWAPNQIFLL